MQQSNMQQERCPVQPWIVCMTASLYFFYIFIQMLKFNAIGPDLMVDFRIGSTGLGVLSSIYFWGNVLFLFPAGLLLDRFSTKKILTIVMTTVIVATYLFSFTHSVFEASWCFLLIGLAGSFGLLIPLRLVSRWFPPEKMALASGLGITIGFLGAMVAQAPLTMLTNAVGWRHAMQWDAGLGVIIFILMMFSVKDFPPGMTREMSHEQATSLSFLWHSIKNAITNKQNWLFGLYTCLVNLPIFVIGGVFGMRFLEQVDHLSEDQAGVATMLLFIGAMAGSPAFGWLSDKMKKRKPAMYLGALVSFVIMLVIMYFNNLNYITVYALFIGLGFFTSSQVISYPVIAESNPNEIVGTGLGMGSTLIMSGGAIFVPLFGWLLDLKWTGQMLHGEPLHSIYDYRFALWILPLTLIISMVIIVFGKETNCKKIV